VRRFMKLGSGIIMHGLPATVVCLVLMLCSCRSAFMDPFRSVDVNRLALAESAMTLVNHRAKPASAVVGKRSLTLADCRSIALANNLDVQVARTDELTKRAVEWSNKTKLLPHFLASGELSQRDNPPYSYSDVLGQEGSTPNPGRGGTGVTNYSTAHERSTWRYSLELRWSPTDAALAYYLSKSSVNDRLKVHYQRVRIAQKLLAVVDGAFFRLLGLQQSRAAAERLTAARSTVAAKMKRAFERKLVGIDQYARATQQAIRARRMLAKICNEIEKQRNILASAMALSPDYCVDGGFVLVGELVTPGFSAAMCDLEMQAVRNRPEAVEAGLSHLNSVNDLKRTIVKYCPKVTGFWRYTHDKDKYLYNKDWKDVGVQVYFDLLDWMSNVYEHRATEFNSAKTRQEMGTVALAITSQVRVAGLQYFDSLDELQSTRAALVSTAEVLKVAKDRSSRDDLDLLALREAEANMLQNRIENTRALGEANALLAELQGTMGANYNEPAP
jgi:outer membrane protein, multidrug efflux system